MLGCIRRRDTSVSPTGNTGTLPYKRVLTSSNEEGDLFIMKEEFPSKFTVEEAL